MEIFQLIVELTTGICNILNIYIALKTLKSVSDSHRNINLLRRDVASSIRSPNDANGTTDCRR